MDNIGLIINKADIGDYLYIIIFAVVMLISLLKNVKKSQPQPQAPPPSQSYDDFDSVEEQPPQTLEELMRRMMQAEQPPKAEEQPIYSETSDKQYYQPIVCEIGGTLGNSQFSQSPIMLEEEVIETIPFEFDIRQAVISNEILNRKY